MPTSRVFASRAASRGSSQDIPGQQLSIRANNDWLAFQADTESELIQQLLKLIYQN